MRGFQVAGASGARQGARSSPCASRFSEISPAWKGQPLKFGKNGLYGTGSMEIATLPRPQSGDSRAAALSIPQIDFQ
jgi:hypothetical protein